MSFFVTPEFWVLVAVLIFFGLLIYLKVPAAMAKALDSRAERIQAELDEAQNLRAEAERLLTEIKAQREETERLAADMLAQAKEDAERMRKDAAVKLEEQIVRRTEMAERKIATAEAQAMADVKAAAAELAAEAARTVLAGRLAASTTDPLVDKAIGQMASKLQ
ncbi:F0F1 ATP synthase subunit B [Phenylobacterium sp.]|jgi:F-type H+-transporting ATPase subunit b|uniref:F0F1 ATP synthase subunit B n=1 Tax=Phenylobacterium sp. TaxID=1871053 RepID=UPI000C985FD7|nr:F0F1 ATP synthase subunit B [Phenylobacterium sp.]MAK83185.1 ATP F0F1 synthase subunit B [Phenylobacterium sp.]MBU2136727.1 F0F1 ATP synthase subunit B [Alphaproteobacteria bacterium]|tara:strand:- start:12271 stop:12762 length:492 start_codon:yes stop_codon:yes gene_type:complete